MALIALAALGMAFAAVPAYRMFCQLTGFDGTPLRAEKAPGAVAGQIGVRFDANVDPRMPWRFEPLQNQVRISPGAKTTIYYQATNLSARPITGHAVFNVSPFMMTLGTATISFGIALTLTSGVPVYGLPDAFGTIPAPPLPHRA